jgi:hypothetical protein
VGPVSFSFDVTLTTPGTLTINGFEAGIADFVAALSQGGHLVTSASQVPDTPPFFFSLTEPMASGTYLFKVTGNADTGAFGLKIGSTNAPFVSTVPIPGSLVLFLSGLSLLGFWGWTKRRKGGSGSSSLEAAAF